MAYVNLKKMPSAKKQYVTSIENFTGGLNLKELDYRISNSETPEMKNLWWKDGVLCCRDGQKFVGSLIANNGFTLIAVYDKLWHGNAFIHVYHPGSSQISAGGRIFAVNINSGGRHDIYTVLDSSLAQNQPVFNTPGTFFQYNDKLYYKTKGYYVAISYDSSPGVQNHFPASNVSAYTPVTYINCDPKTGAGTVYQPENRISSNATLWYNAARTITCEGYTLSSQTTVTYTPTAEEEADGEEGFTVVLNTNDGTASKPVLEESTYVNAVGNDPVTGTRSFHYYTAENIGWANMSAVVSDKTGISGSVTVNAHLFFSNSGYTGEYLLFYMDNDTWMFVYPLVNPNYQQYIYLTTSELRARGVTIGGTISSNASFKVTVSVASTYDIADYGITFTGPLGSSATVNVNFSFQNDYYFPLEVESIVSVEVDGVVRATNAYSPIYKSGSSGPIIGVHINTAPVMRNPPINNTVKITYSKSNTTAYNNIMDCTMAMTYGGTGALAIVMAGSATQPNAYFWNGQTSISVDPGYFPMTQYQLAGDTNEPITGFGKQQGYLIIFKEHSVGRTSMDTQTVDGRLTIDLAYVGINAKIGCDLPKTIQLVENNLVWCNKSEGIHFLANTSAAYENNVINISQKINDSHESWTTGLLNEIQTYPSTVFAYDDDRHYWLVVNGNVWLWDYYISNYKDPSWFFFDGIVSKGFVQDGSKLWCFDSATQELEFVSGQCADIFGYVSGTSTLKHTPIPKVFRFAAQYFGNYDNKKNIEAVIFSLRSKTKVNVAVRYLTDLETRDDRTPLVYEAPNDDPGLIHNNFSCIFKRRPMCRRVQYFTVRLSNAEGTNPEPDEDMAIISAQIFYTFQGVIR